MPKVVDQLYSRPPWERMMRIHERIQSGNRRRSRTSHLFCAKRQPLFCWFEDQIRIGFEAEVRPQRVVLTAQQAG